MWQGGSDEFIAIHIDVAIDTESTQIINATHMIVMDMRDENAIQLAKRHTQELHADVWSCIHQDASGFCLYHHRTAEALVLRILASANLTITSQNRNTARCSCSE